MKVVNIQLNKNFPEDMAGREITVYIYKYSPILNETINGFNPQQRQQWDSMVGNFMPQQNNNINADK